MEYLIVGGTGFIGSKISKQLLRAGIKCLRIGSEDCDLLDFDAVHRVIEPLLKNSILIYAAGIPRLKVDDFNTMCRNLLMVENMLKACINVIPKKIIFLSSVDVYGTPEKLPITENSQLEPERLYAIGKIAAEYMRKSWAIKTRNPALLLRLPGIFGPGSREKGLVDRVVYSISNNKSVSLVNRGNVLRDFLFVDDVARLITALIQKEVNESIINLATGYSTSIGQIVDKISAVLGPCIVDISDDISPECDLIFDVSLLRRLVPYFIETPFSEALESYQINLQ